MKTLEILGATHRVFASSLAAAMVAVGLLSGCGQTGPLYLPAPGQDRQKAPVRTTPSVDATDPAMSGIPGPIDGAPVNLP
ncbi:MAG: LPS translocon maturation chaperone LptM [Gammaproteobacteria bacterium]